MDSDHGFFDAFLSKLNFLINLAGLLAILFFGCYALYRIPANWRLRRDATSELERLYFELVLYGCYAGGYAFLVTIMTVINEDGFGLYWPALSGKWTAHGGIGQICHSNALIYDAGLCLMLCGLLLWFASTLGRSAIACDGTEIFLVK